MEHINNDMVNVAWNAFGLTGGVEEYLMYRDIKKKYEEEHQSLYNTNKITANIVHNVEISEEKGHG